MRLPPRCLSLTSAIALTCCVQQAAADEPLATVGIGLQVCSKLAAAMKPEEGLDNQANYLVVYWVQGYMSAANIATLEGDSDYVDLNVYNPDKIIALVHDFCTEHPDKKPISAIDDLLETAPRLTGEWEKGVVGWAADDEASGDEEEK